MRRKFITVRYRYLLLIFFVVHNSVSFAQSHPFEASAFAGIEGEVFDAETGNSLPARIVITDSASTVTDSYYKLLPGFFTDEHGRFQQALKPGNYRIAVYHGIDYLSQEMLLLVHADSGCHVRFFLKPWYPLRKYGWFCGDGHDHLYTDIHSDTSMVAAVRKICVAQGIDFMCTAQGWAGYNDSNWREGYSAFSNDRFHLHYGSEMPKYRTGHTWWLGQTSTYNYFWSTMDTAYENNYFQSDKSTTAGFDDLSFPNIPDVEVVQRLKLANGAIAIMAHPTSWWWQKSHDREKYITNVAAYLPFGLLAGKIWDGMVVMGYDPDHYFYQNLWFHVLNEGYRMPPLAELDGGFGKGDKFYYGSMRTYYHLNGAFSMEKLKEAVRKGRTFVTSGPIIMANVDKRFEVGDIVPANGGAHTLHLQAYASGEKDDYLSYVIVFRNGRIFKLWDTRSTKPREFSQQLVINEASKAWYVIKVYGKNAWSQPEHLDVLRVCEKDSTEHFKDYNKGRIDVAITSPFYFWPATAKDPDELISTVNLTVTAPDGEKALKNCRAELLVNGQISKTLLLRKGQGEFSMPVNGIVRISAPGCDTIYRGLYLDYPPYRKLMEQLITGRWKEKVDPAKLFNPGEVPWKAFHFAEAREVLSHVKWKIEMTRNARDREWEKFEQIFNN